MEPSQAKQILQSLAQGVDPITGEEFPEESPYNRPNTIRALYFALQALEHHGNWYTESSPLPANTGIAWTPSEECLLIQRFDRGMTISQLAKEHRRTGFSIETRLVRLGKLPKSRRIDGSGIRNPSK